MTDNYVNELIQVAAVAICAAQHYERGDTDMGGVFEYLNAVLKERRLQELKWGNRSSSDMLPRDWLTVLVEEVGEVGREILERKL